MEIKETLKSAIDSLKINKLRSLLTMLGIIIGIAAVIIISSVGKGVVTYVSDELSSFGTNFFQINPGNNMMSAITGGGEPLTTGDVSAIKDANISNIQNVVEFSMTSKAVSANDESIRVSVYGMTPEGETLLKPNMIYGEFLTNDDINSRVAVIGSEVADKLFGENTDPVGESIKIDEMRFSVIGVSKSGGNLFGSFFNTSITLPLETLQHQITGVDELVEIDVEVKNTDYIKETMDEVELVLKDYRKIADDEENDFIMESFTESLNIFETITNILTLFITGISAISLVVGGIGVMNIMLVSVTERTKEIGLLKSIGAKRKDILSQFLVESSIITTVGGFIGIILGIGITYLVSVLVGIPFIVNMVWVVIATIISISVGIIFGLYPAQKAAKLHAIDALRFE
ncbi:MAG: ABC transporter permease [Candidatus Shapirobacteria bacterium]|nr:ABC transporter permease [Candidatus Shapirobacteria bacterium]